MAADEKRDFVKAIAPTLKSQGFKKKDATWHRASDEFIETFNVQGSQWSKSFYLNLGIYIRALGDKTTPPQCRCHIRNRVADLVDDRARYNELLDLENSISAAQRFRELNEIIAGKAIPWLEEFSDDRRIIDWITGGQRHGLPILATVFEHYRVSRKAKQNKPTMDQTGPISS